MTLNKEQVELMTAEDCSKHLKQLEKTYPLDKPLSKLSPELFAQVDDIANTLLWLEDRLRYCNQSEIAINANKVRYGRE